MIRPGIIRRGRGTPPTPPRHAASSPRVPDVPAAGPGAYPPPAPPFQAPPLPSFTPRHAAPTAPMPVYPARPFSAPPADPLRRDVPVRPAVRPVIGDSMPALPPEPVPEPVPVSVLPDRVPYCGPGWAGRLMSMRVRDGEWDELAVIVERGMGRNVADMHAGYRRSRAAIADGVAHQLAAIGRPDLAVPLLQRTQELLLEAAGGAR